MRFEVFRNISKVLLYGYGVEGRSSERFLKSKFPHLDVIIYEDPKAAMEEGGKGTIKNDVNWEEFDMVVKSPGVPPRNIPKKSHHKVTSNTALFFENLPEHKRKKVIGVSGSKGKSTTVKFTDQLLKNAGIRSIAVGNFGAPFLDIFDDFLAGKYEFVVAECSSFQLHDLKVSPGIALFISLFADHLMWHEGVENYVRDKKNLWRYQKTGDVLFLPEDLDFLVSQNTPSKNSMEGFPSNVVFTKAVSSELFPKNSVLRAPHFRKNLGTVWALAGYLGLKDLEHAWKVTAQNFEMIEHRLEFFLEKSGIRFYNDSISTGPESTGAAIEFFGEDLGTLILGGKDLGVGEFDGVVKKLKRFAPAVKVILIDGSDVAIKFKNAAQRENFTAFELVSDLQQAVEKSFFLTPKGKSCVFSPGGKSFDCFENYMVRGKVFKDLVRRFEN